MSGTRCLFSWKEQVNSLNREWQKRLAENAAPLHLWRVVKAYLGECANWIVPNSLSHFTCTQHMHVQRVWAVIQACRARPNFCYFFFFPPPDSDKWFLTRCSNGRSCCNHDSAQNSIFTRTWFNSLRSGCAVNVADRRAREGRLWSVHLKSALL